jgi:hypothetical protein
MRLIRPGIWELRVSDGRWRDGRPRTLNRNVAAKTEAEAAPQLVAFVDEMSRAQLPDTRQKRDVTVGEGCLHPWWLSKNEDLTLGVQIDWYTLPRLRGH